MRLAMFLTGTLTAMVPAAARAQSLTIGAYGVAATHNEVTATNRQNGFGGGGVLQLRIARFAVEASGYLAGVDAAEDTAVTSFDILEGDLRIQYSITPIVDLEVGVGRRTIDPELAAQDVGLVRLGARLHNQLASVAGIWVRGAYAPITDFNGGGSANLALEVGFGLTIGPADGRWHGRAEYSFQRINRSVRDVDVPIQVETARFGIAYTIF